ncbi:hypothetical protein ASPZODRAFT_155049 [Penicilliopsis zonata CBS 506.65]|uniref:Sodium/calcium exchanger membrane region domain-containing protein n=1 Tax=Penicilliopsis zonata CBS 506.65 TaxID=1073090 RepID=A0A1L9S6I1_9EURO|nr:hypothetical protein ASPZODRAFT_155049 [Penicilliopsis zonata CBS 506.65]OJJ42782.1 hypothetical protein ASPZODRAFT_155049 [Penicilliopsis zonata CBS 506.65]
MNWDTLCYSIATFIAGIFVLDYGADKFIDHTVILGRRFGISPTLIALLTAGAEYEELAVIIASILQDRTPLALGNVMGSTISNILGAFSLGLVCHPEKIHIDSSAKIYSSILSAVATLFVVLAYFQQLNRVTGGLLIAGFILYLVSIGVAIYLGVQEPLEGDIDGNSDSDSDSENEESENSPLLNRRPPKRAIRHIFQLVLGLLALSLSGYILAHSAGSIADCLHLSGTVFGLTVIAFATTLPEKLVAVVSSSRGEGGIIVAATAGSNIFLLTLCMGIIAVVGIPDNRTDTFIWVDLLVVWLSSLSFTAVVFLGPSRLVGLVFLAAYIVYIVMRLV